MKITTTNGTTVPPTQQLSGITGNCNGQAFTVNAGSAYTCNITGAGIATWQSNSSTPAAGKFSY